jgi:ABC-type lipoprotein release transport system permease subunit
MKVTRTVIMANLTATLISLVGATLLHETYAPQNDNPQQIPVGASKNEQNMTMTITPKPNLTDIDIKVIRMHIDEAKNALERGDINGTMIRLYLAQHLLELVQPYQQHSSTPNLNQ